MENVFEVIVNFKEVVFYTCVMFAGKVKGSKVFKIDVLIPILKDIYDVIEVIDTSNRCRRIKYLGKESWVGRYKKTPRESSLSTGKF